MSPRVRHGLIAAGLATLALFPAAAAAQTSARCELGNSDGETYKGPCIFTLGPKGSFTLSRTGKVRVIEDFVEVIVTVVRPGVADVSGRTRAGTRLNWGRATRGANGSACWRGTSFWICVYG